MLKKNNYKYKPLKLSLIYFLIGALWILLSDRVANSLSNSQETLALISTYKGWLFVIVMTIIIYFLIRKSINNFEFAKMAEKKLIASNQELQETYEQLEEMNEEIIKQYDELKVYSDELSINEDRLSHAQAIAHVGNWELDLAKKEMWASKEFFNIYGLPYKTPIIPLQVAQGVVQKEDRALKDEALSNLIRNDEKYDVKFRITRDNDGEERVVHSHALLERNSQGVPQKVIGVLRDITEQEMTEKQIRYYAEHDVMTGLYNRWFYEQEISKISSLTESAGIIMCDIDGLKLINDTQGQLTGDQYLISFAKILKESCLDKGIVARIGGDEFAIILKNINEEKMDEIYHLIKSGVEQLNKNKQSLLLSISIGMSFCKSCDQESIVKTLKEAEEQMNFHKLLQGQSNRGKTVDILMKTLEARDYITEGHSDRLQQMMSEICQKVKLKDFEKGRLTLFAHFHDIGKVGIPDSILFKPGKLDKEEYEEMKKHCEIGYRIANASPDLAHISDLILKHHEWWNGKGYPLGIAGEEIPLECRILAIADAYDSMSNDRPYRKAMPYAERIDELRRFSGIQFDPNLVTIFIDLLQESGEV